MQNLFCGFLRSKFILRFFWSAKFILRFFWSAKFILRFNFQGITVLYSIGKRYIKKIEPQNKFGTKSENKINLERKEGSKIELNACLKSSATSTSALIKGFSEKLG
ncbi:MAG: hypothetical protein DRR00_00025 [Candidatus Parabeggiatoa sp. nov. 3]|nr:MAG: hypothetical protein DRR00_00025 [Gammaproteobacteria bacterium]RKZ65264.1 MAG: hypothetical protein DRQ99_13160 [Gammaproteobacteria bacterium]